MNNPLVTIITPAYNCAKFLPETIDSVLDQSYRNIEYRVFDDGSTDNTLDILAGYEYGEPRFTAFAHRNMGEQRTVNKALTMVKGKYFMIVNADDPLLPGAIEHLTNFMETHPDILCAYPDWDCINEDGSLKFQTRRGEYDFRYMVKYHTCLSSPCGMFRSTIIRDVGYRDISLRWLGDFDFYLRVGLAGKMAHIPETLATWRHREGQASGDKSDARAKEHIRMIQKFYSMPDIPDGILAVRREAICQAYLLATVLTDSKLKMVEYLLKAFLSYPPIAFRSEFRDKVTDRAYYILRR